MSDEKTVIRCELSYNLAPIREAAARLAASGKLVAVKGPESSFFFVDDHEGNLAGAQRQVLEDSTFRIVVR